MSTKSKLRGVNREASQTAFIQLMAGGVQDLTKLSGNHQLTMWISTTVFEGFCKTITTELPSTAETSMPISSEEADITHYIGGFVSCKLKKRHSDTKYKDVVTALESDEEPATNTLIAAKSRGKLTNLSKDGQCMFVELENVFRFLFPSSVVNASPTVYIEKCVGNDTVQDCFHSATHHLDTSLKGDVLSDMISLYFKVRIHQKCKCLIEKVRNKKRDSKKEKALRSKLAK